MKGILIFMWSGIFVEKDFNFYHEKCILPEKTNFALHLQFVFLSLGIQI